MAVQALPKPVSLSFLFHTGMSEDGKSITSRATLSNLRDDLTNEELKEISDIVISLVKHEVVEVTMIRSHLLI